MRNNQLYRKAFWTCYGAAVLFYIFMLLPLTALLEKSVMGNPQHTILWILGFVSIWVATSLFLALLTAFTEVPRKTVDDEELLGLINAGQFVMRYFNLAGLAFTVAELFWRAWYLCKKTDHVFFPPDEPGEA